MKAQKHQSGFTVVEMLVAIFLGSIISVAAFQFYVAQHNNMITQQNVSDMQQNIRSSMDDITHQIRNAGANLPPGMKPLVSYDVDPDSICIYYADMGSSLSVGDHTQKAKANPIHITAGTDVSQFQAGDQVYLWHQATKSGEWFQVTKVAANSGKGWIEIHHQDGDLSTDPLPGDLLIKIKEFSYFVDASDSTHPNLMRRQNAEAPQVFASNIERLDFNYVLSSGDTVSTLSANDTVYVVRIELAAKTEQADYEAERLGSDGRRRRTLRSDVLVRNQRF